MSEDNYYETNQDENSRIIDVDIEKEMKSSFLDYSMSVIIARALPDVRDGLKPVHRRILYAMFEDGITPDKPYRKCATTVGDVLGRYHPHGDASVYDALVRLAQDFSMRYMLVDGHGNFGSVDGDPPAAYRYTEARMAKISLEMMRDIDKETIDFIPNFDDSLKEPTVLPSRFPNLLVNGSTGIAVGMATNMPPHNLGEVCEAVELVLQKPDATLDELMEKIQGPDFPTAGIIMGKRGIRAAYGTGRGKITLRSRAEIEDTKNGRQQIVVTELPYQVNKARLIESIADLVKDKKIDGISNIQDHSDREGMRITIDVKRDANAEVVLNNLYKMSQLQITYGIINLAIDDGVPRIMTLKQLIEKYISHQLEIIYRRTVYDLRKARERAHILEGLKIAQDNIDEVIKIIRASRTIPESKERLMERFGLDDIQASAIVAMRLGQLAGLEREKIEEELRQIEARIAEYELILSSEEKRKEIISTELAEIARKFSDKRRTEIVNISGEVDVEDLIAEEDCVITLTAFGYVKRQKTDTYQAQHRGGRGISGMATREEDTPIEMFIGSTHNYIFFFSNLGRVFRLKGYEIPESGRTTKGINIVNLLQLNENEKITNMIGIDDAVTDGSVGDMYLMTVTKYGVIKRTPFSAFDNFRKKGLIALTLREGDEMVRAVITNGENEIILGTKLGMSIRFSEKDVRSMGRTAAGVRAIKLSGSDQVVGVDIINSDSLILTVSDKGYGRVSDPDNYRLQSRGGKGIINYRIASGGEVAAIRVVNEDEDLIIINSDGVIIRIAVAEIRKCARPSKGVRVMRIEDGSRVVALTSLAHDPDEVSEHLDGSDAGEEEELTPEELAEENEGEALSDENEAAADDETDEE